VKKWFMLAAVVVGALIVGAGVSWASIPDSGGVISACYNNTNGSLRVIDAEGGASCSGNETALNWEQAAPTVVLEQQRVETETATETIDAGASFLLTVACPAGWVVTGGGHTLNTTDVIAVLSEPDATFPPGGPLLHVWNVRVRAIGDPQVDPPVTFSGKVKAVCVRLTTS
jgi:hypothetical protein